VAKVREGVLVVKEDEVAAVEGEEGASNYLSSTSRSRIIMKAPPIAREWNTLIIGERSSELGK
jgi:hypothetical protein